MYHHNQLETIIFPSISALTCYYNCSTEVHSILRQRHIQHKEEKQGAKLSGITLVTVFINLTNYDDPCAAFTDQQSRSNLRKRQSLLQCTSKDASGEKICYIAAITRIWSGSPLGHCLGNKMSRKNLEWLKGLCSECVKFCCTSPTFSLPYFSIWLLIQLKDF